MIKKNKDSKTRRIRPQRHRDTEEEKRARKFGINNRIHLFCKVIYYKHQYPGSFRYLYCYLFLSSSHPLILSVPLWFDFHFPLPLSSSLFSSLCLCVSVSLCLCGSNFLSLSPAVKRA